VAIGARSGGGVQIGGPGMNNKRQEALSQMTSSALVSGTQGFHSVAIGDAVSLNKVRLFNLDGKHRKFRRRWFL